MKKKTQTHKKYPQTHKTSDTHAQKHTHTNKTNTHTHIHTKRKKNTILGGLLTPIQSTIPVVSTPPLSKYSIVDEFLSKHTNKYLEKFDRLQKNFSSKRNSSSQKTRTNPPEIPKWRLIFYVFNHLMATIFSHFTKNQEWRMPPKKSKREVKLFLKNLWFELNKECLCDVRFMQVGKKVRQRSIKNTMFKECM